MEIRDGETDHWTYMTYKRGVGKGRPDISVLVELTVLSQL